MKKQIQWALLTLLWMTSHHLVAQSTFWQKDPITLPDQPTEKVTQLDGNEDIGLFLGSNKGLYHSKDIGKTWIPLPFQGSVDQIVIRGSSILIQSGPQKVFLSQDTGKSWMLIFHADQSQVTDLLIEDDLTFFITTGHTVSGPGFLQYRGEGVYKTTDHGITWGKMNTGLSGDRYYAFIEMDSRGNLVLGVNEYNIRDGAILISKDGGFSWTTTQDLYFMSSGTLSGTRIVTLHSLVVSPDDRIYASFSGSTGGAATQLTLYRPLDSIGSPGQWDHFRRNGGGYSWFYEESHQLFFTENGHVFSNRIGSSTRSDGLLFRSRGSTTFEDTRFDRLYGSGLVYGTCSILEFGQVILAVQAGDNQLYSRDKTHLGTLPEVDLHYSIFPNPATDHIVIDSPTQVEIDVHVTDPMGRIWRSVQFDRGIEERILDVTGIPSGVYLLSVESQGGSYFERVVVR